MSAFLHWWAAVFESNGHWADRMIDADEKAAERRPQDADPMDPSPLPVVESPQAAAL